MAGLEERLKDIDKGKPPENPPTRSDIERALEQADSEDAKDVLRAQLRRRKAEEDLRAREAEDRLRQRGGGTMTDEKRREEERNLREEISATAMTLLEKGVDPKIVGQYILGSTPITPITVSGGAAPAQGLTIKDVKEIMGMATENKGGNELEGVLEKLTAKVEAIGSRQPPDPIALAQQQAQAIGATYEALKTLGIIKEPEVRTEGGEPLEVVRERNRHAERMEEVKADREYKGKITEIASSIPERIGQGMSGQLGGEDSSGSGGELEYLICPEEGCGAKIYITPETGSQVKCQKCGSIYTRKATTESKTE